jgi:hypothetical protein
MTLPILPCFCTFQPIILFPIIYLQSITLPNFTAADVCAVVQFIYTGHCVIRGPSFKRFMGTAKILGVIGLCPEEYHRSHFDKLDDARQWEEPIVDVSFLFIITFKVISIQIINHNSCKCTPMK